MVPEASSQPPFRIIKIQEAGRYNADGGALATITLPQLLNPPINFIQLSPYDPKEYFSISRVMLPNLPWAIVSTRNELDNAVAKLESNQERLASLLLVAVVVGLWYAYFAFSFDVRRVKRALKQVAPLSNV